MTYVDSRGIELTTASRASVERYETALDLLASYFLDPLATIESALAEDPDFVSGHCLRAGIGVLAGERSAEPLIQESLREGERLAAKASERERRHFAAAKAWLDGDFHRAGELYGRIVIDHPRDLLALVIAHVSDFYVGRTRMQRDRIAHVLPAWDESVPGYGYVLGMLAFGFEETNLFERALDTARSALALNPRDSWAVHAGAHVFEMTGRIPEGIEWLTTREADWAPNNTFAYHNYWHLALYHLEAGDVRRGLELFDTRIYPRPSCIALELVDASALLFRLYLRGIDVGERATSVADAWSNPVQHGFHVFSDVHAVMALVIDGRLSEAREIVRALERTAAEDGSNPDMVRQVGLPFARSVLAFAEGRYPAVVETLLPLRLVANHFGGSNAQRDVIEQLLIESAVRAGETRLARALLSERQLVRHESPWARTVEHRLASGARGRGREHASRVESAAE
ncbi:MAG TPA: tetratricopeptide repeat protein [Polyangiaceae bacterium]|nr:tetratricopeptide repeat protein [Polyangiaceae bacterium]